MALTAPQKTAEKIKNFGPGRLCDQLHELLHQPYDEVLDGGQFLFTADGAVHKP